MKQQIWFLSILGLALWIVGCESGASVLNPTPNRQQPTAIATRTTFIGAVSSPPLELQPTALPSITPTLFEAEENSDSSDGEPRPPDCDPPWLGGISLGVPYALAADGHHIAYTTDKFDLIITELTETGDPRTIPVESSISIPHTRPVFHLAWSSDNKRLAYLTSNPTGLATLHLLNADDPSSPPLDPIYTNVEHFIWSPNGQILAYSGKVAGQLNTYLFDLRNNQKVQLTATGSHRPISWSPDSQFLALESSNDGYETSFIEIIEVATQQSMSLTTGELCEARPVWSPDGQKIAYLRQSTPEVDKDNWDLFIIDRATGQSYLLASTPDMMEYGLTWSPNGQQLAVTSWRLSDGNVLVFAIDLETNEIIQLLEETEGEIPLSPQWFPDGQDLLAGTYAPNDGSLLSLDVLNIYTHERTRLVSFS